MKKHILLLASLLPFITYAQNNVSNVKPVKQITIAKPAVNYSVITHNPALKPTPLFTPSPFLSLKNTTLPSGTIVHRDAQTGMPIMIDNIPFTGTISKTSAVTEIAKVMQTIAPALGLLSVAEELSILSSQTDEIGITHIKLQQQFKGLPVYGAQAWLHVKGDKICFNGRTEITPRISSTTPILSINAATAIIRTDVSMVNTFQEFSFTDEILLRLKQYETELVVMPTGLGKSKLAYHVTVRPNVLNRWEYFIDANTGAILNKYDNTCTLGDTPATAVDLQGITRSIRTFNANSNFYLIDASKSMYTGTQNALPAAGKGIIITLDAQNTSMNTLQYAYNTSATNSWGAAQKSAISAHFNAQTAWDYFKNTFNRNSINGNGGDVVSFVNVAEEDGGGLDNAFWNGQYMFYGNGNTQFKPLAGSIDVGGHEMTHGVVQETANLEYQGEPGAMNESFADVFGSLIDPTNFKLGEDVVKLSAFPSGCLRDMQDPHNGGTGLSSPGWQPSHVNEQYTGTQDNGGVHINSGIPNHAYYLIATALTKNVAAQIYYRALSLYLSKTSKFFDLRLAVVKAAEDLHGVNSTQVNAVKQSFDAVGITDGTPTNTNPTLPQNPGSNKLLVLNLDNSDANTIYLTDDNVTNFTPISQTSVNHKPSVTDDGSYAVFVGTDNNIYSLLLSSPFTQTQLTTDGYWQNVAISKNGEHLAATSQFQDTAIWVYDFGLQQWGKFGLYNPTTAQGVNAGGVLYADALEWDYSGNNVLYDSYNKLTGPSGQFLDFWDIGFIRAWNEQGNNFNDGEIFKAYNNLDEGISIGNPTFAKNSPSTIAFDYIDANTNEFYVLGANLELNNTGTIYQNDQAGYPTYNPQDNKLAFNSSSQGAAVLAFINLDQSKISGVNGTATAVINLGGYAQWFATGVRNLPNAIGDVEMSEIKLYPNPTNTSLTLVLPENFGTAQLEIYNLLGEKVYSKNTLNSKIVNTDVSNLSSGSYVVRLSNANKTTTKRFQKF